MLRLIVSRQVVPAFLLASLPVLASAAEPAVKTAAPAASPAPKPTTPAAAPAPSGGQAPAADDVISAYLSDGRKVPLFDERSASVPAATVDQDVVTIGDLAEALAASHENRTAAKKAASEKLDSVMNRLINVHLIALEAREMDIDQVDEVKAEIERFNQINLRTVLQAKITKDVKAEPADVKAAYSEMARQWKVRSLLFASEKDAKAAHARMQTKGFEIVAKESVAAKKAKGGPEAQFITREGMLSAVRDAVEKAKLKTPVRPFRAPAGWIVLQVDEVRTNEDPAKKQEADRIALARAQTKALEKFYDALRKKYLKENPALLKTLNYEAKKPGYQTYAKDQRVLAHIAGEKPVTVAELTGRLQHHFFHGIDKAIQEKQVNVQKKPLYDEIVYKRIFTKEALLERVQDTDEYKRSCEQYATSLLFAAFLNKVVIPDVKVTDAEAQKYYDGHRIEFTYPAMYRLDAITFTDAKRAQATLDKIKGGTDFKFLKGSSDGQVPIDDRVLRVDGTMPVTEKSLPRDLVKLLSSAKRGDYRLYADPRGQHSVVQVVDVTPSQLQPLERVKPELLKKLFNQNADRAVDDWAAKLRKARTVKVLVTRVGA